MSLTERWQNGRLPSSYAKFAKLLEPSLREVLPCHRIINSQVLSVKGECYLRHKQALINEGIIFDLNDKIKLKDYFWRDLISSFILLSINNFYRNIVIVGT